MSEGLRVRRSIEDLQADFESGNTKPLDDLMRAFKGIKELPPEDPRSFFVLGGYHGEPFRGAGWGNASYWGGYCNHGNVLFPTWHRVYLLKLEEALRSIPGCADVTLPFWDETSPTSLAKGIPWALTQENYTLDGVSIPNPLRSYVFQINVRDHLSPFPDADYSKPKGYETVRYPLSGLVGPADIATTKAHNAQFPDHAKNVDIVNWLTSSITVDGKVIPTNVHGKYLACLDAPNYTVFSNTTSAAAWNDNAPVKATPLESPHNSMHLAVGGFDLPNLGDFSPIPGANGDMGENDTAGFDPIFFFHHCFVDRVFWLWQKRHGATDDIEIIAGYPGTNSVDSQGPTPGVAPNSWLSVGSPLDPFVLEAPGGSRPYTSRDCLNIETQLGYTYGPGSLDEPALAAAASLADGAPERAIHVSGLNRAKIRGSFLISAFAEVDGESRHLGTEAILSRWHVDGCANCQTHLRAGATFSLRALRAEAVADDAIRVEVLTRDGPLPAAGGLRALAATETAEPPAFRVEIR